MIRRVLIAVGSVAVASMTVIPGVPEDVVGDVFISSATVLAWVFAAGYGRLSQWRLYPAGRAMLYLLVSFAVFGTQVSASRWLGTDYTWWAEIRMCAYAGLLFTTFNLLWTWMHERSKADGLPPHL